VTNSIGTHKHMTAYIPGTSNKSGGVKLVL